MLTSGAKASRLDPGDRRISRPAVSAVQEPRQISSGRWPRLFVRGPRSASDACRLDPGASRSDSCRAGRALSA